MHIKNRKLHSYSSQQEKKESKEIKSFAQRLKLKLCSVRFFCCSGNYMSASSTKWVSVLWVKPHIISITVLTFHYNRLWMFELK